MSPPDRLTMDEIIAENVRQLRKKRSVSLGRLSWLLGVGEHVVRDMERPRKGRPQREFNWAELVALCAALDTNLFELVLPSKGVEVADLRHLLPTDSDSPDVANYHPGAQIGRDGLGWRLFGVGGDYLTPKVLKTLTQNLTSEYDRRIARLEQLLGIGSSGVDVDPEIARSFEDESITDEEE